MRNIFSALCVLCVMVASASAQNISRIEYFFNTDPGFGKATAIAGFTSSPDVASFPASIDLSSVSNSINNLYVRAKDANGNWSITNRLAFIKGTAAGNISTLEYFIDIDPGVGKATQVVLTPGQEISNYIFNVNVSSLAANTPHNLYVRVKDIYGVWSFTNVISFTRTIGTGIDQITDASAAFKVFPNPATEIITLQCATEKEIDKVELMDVQGKIIQVQTSGSSTEKQINISMLGQGVYFLKITVGKDAVYKKVVKD